MRSITVLRNCCAHHSRLWNRYLSTAPQMNASLRDAWVNIQNVDANKVYAISCCIAYWLDSMGYGDDLKKNLKYAYFVIYNKLNKYGDDLKKNLKSLLVSCPQVDLAAMGFPKYWDSETLWFSG